MLPSRRSLRRLSGMPAARDRWFLIEATDASLAEGSARRRLRRRKGPIQLGQFLGAEGDVERLQILLQVRGPAHADQGHDILAARQDPGDRQLRRNKTLGRRHPFQMGHRREILALEARQLRAGISRRQVSPDDPGQETLGDDAVRHHTDAQFPRRGQNLGLDQPRRQRVFDFQRGNRMDGVRAAKLLRTGLGKSRGNAPFPPG